MLFWKQISFRNFRLSQQLATRSADEQERLLAWFVELLAQGRLQCPAIKQIHWDPQSADRLSEAVAEALRVAGERSLGTKKHVFSLNNGLC